MCKSYEEQNLMKAIRYVKNAQIKVLKKKSINGSQANDISTWTNGYADLQTIITLRKHLIKYIKQI